MNPETRPHQVIQTISLDEDLTLLVTDHDDEDDVRWWIEGDWHADLGCCCQQCAPHEQPGHLPAALRQRFIHRCGATTSAGAPCRNVTREGRCSWHREASDA